MKKHKLIFKLLEQAKNMMTFLFMQKLSYVPLIRHLVGCLMGIGACPVLGYVRCVCKCACVAQSLLPVFRV